MMEGEVEPEVGIGMNDCFSIWDWLLNGVRTANPFIVDKQVGEGKDEDGFAADAEADHEVVNNAMG